MGKNKGNGLKYKNIAVTGHQRSGTHYIAGLIALNFLGHKNYGTIYKNHKFPKISTNINTAYIYTWRDFKNTAKSIFAMRKSFGLNNIKTFEGFLKSNYCDMWDPHKNFEITVTNLKNNTYKTNYVTGFYSKIEYTPKEWWEIYHNRWATAERKKSNIIKVSYNDLKDDFQKTMTDLAIKLGSDKRSFKNIDKKIGWNV